MKIPRSLKHGVVKVITTSGKKYTGELEKIRDDFIELRLEDKYTDRRKSQLKVVFIKNNAIESIRKKTTNVSRGSFKFEINSNLV